MNELGGMSRLKDDPMRRINVKDEDVEIINSYLRLSREEKEFLNEFLRKFGNMDRRESLYELIKVQSEISQLLAERGHLKAFGRTILKISGYVAALTTIAAGIATFIRMWGTK